MIEEPIRLSEYDYYIDPSTGQRFCVNKSTGEYHETFLAELPASSFITTPEERERRRMEAERRKEQAQTKALRKRDNSPLGNFICALFMRDEVDTRLKPETKARLTYLATYAKHDSSTLMDTVRTPMTKQAAQERLGLSNATFYRFWDEVTQADALSLDADGTLNISGDMFHRGKMPKYTGYDVGYTKIYIKALRDLYSRTPVSKHKHLGLIFQLLSLSTLNIT